MTAPETQRDRKPDLESNNGPFPEPSHEQPWASTEAQRGPFERRRGEDRRAARSGESEGATEDRTERRRRWGRRKADVLNSDARETFSSSGQEMVRKFKKPLIGLTLAGVAVPLVNAGVNAPAGAPTEGASEAERTAKDAPAPNRDLEGEVGNYWAESEADMVREQTIEGAVTRYDINQTLAEKIYDAAERHDIEPDIAYGLVFTESTFRLKAVSHVGARGLTQLMPRTAQWLDPSVNISDLYNADKNLDLGFKYLRQLIDKYDGNVENALTAYNRGPGTVDRILDRGGNPDNGYAGKVLAG